MSDTSRRDVLTTAAALAAGGALALPAPAQRRPTSPSASSHQRTIASCDD